QFITDRRDGDTDGNANLFKSFGLPITQNEKDLYTTFTSPTGYLDTAIRNFNQNKILVIAIDKCQYGETLDGKSIHVQLETTGATEYNLYSAFQKSLVPKTSLDNQINDELGLASAIGKNVVFLFSDEISKPNENPSKSWATGYAQS